MCRLADKYQPQTLDDIAGQPVIRHLQAWAAKPDSRCFALEGDPGTGKSTTAYALASALGSHDLFTGLYEEKAADFGVDQARGYFESTRERSAPFRLRPLNGWNVLILEEMEFLSPQTVRYLKVALDGRNMPSKAIVIATSNDLSRLEKAFMQRFDVYRFSSGKSFADGCAERLAEIWRKETGRVDLPAGWKCWGYEGTSFSMRQALNDMGRTINSLGLVEVAA